MANRKARTTSGRHDTRGMSKVPRSKVTKQLTPAASSDRVAKRADEMTGEERALIAVMRPSVNSGIVAQAFKPMGEIDVGTFATCVESEVKRGDGLKAAERMLLSQSHALDALFASLARRAALNVGEYMGAAEVYLKLAMRAQNQCRMTLETLATIKNPPVVFAKQANIAHGHQQVNNGETASHAPETLNRPMGLLEAPGAKPEWMDTGTARTATPSDSPLEAVATVNRAEDA